METLGADVEILFLSSRIVGESYNNTDSLSKERLESNPRHDAKAGAQMRWEGIFSGRLELKELVIECITRFVLA